MKKQLSKLSLICICILMVSGCGKKDRTILNETMPSESEKIAQEKTQPVTGETVEELPQSEPEVEAAVPDIQEVDYSSYFGDMNGCAVFYRPSENQYEIYNSSLAMTQRPPCSTFKIISSLFALEEGVIDVENSVRPWSGEVFWNEAWNQDIDFPAAFQSSCVWYFRQVIDDLGQERIQNHLDLLEYGNSDISDWNGNLNTNNSNPALTGFWIESSLKISPKEQTEVMERIFGPNSLYSEKSLSQLQKVMQVEQDSFSGNIYGKTGSGKQHGVWVDAWFTGFAQQNEKRIYFCVYLGETKETEISSKAAREIAIRILSDTWQE